MKSFLHISRAFARRGRAGLIIFFLICTFALSLTGGALSLAWGIDSAYDERHEALSGPDVLFVVPDIQMSDNLLNDLKAVNGVELVEVEKAILDTVSIDVDGEKQEQRQVFHDAHASRTLGVLEVIEGKLPSNGMGIVLNDYTAMHSDRIDTYSVTIGGEKHDFPVVGRAQEMRYGNYSSGIIGQYIDSQTFKELWDNPQSNRVSVITLKADNGEQAYRDAGGILAQQGVQIMAKNWAENQKNQRLSISRVVVGVVLAFAAVAALVALLLAQFRLAQSVREERAHMGILKALGHTNRPIIFSLLLPYMLTVIVSGVFAYFGALGIARLLSSVVAMQSGFTWQATVNLPLLLGLIVLFAFLTVFVGWLRARRVKRVSALQAIRDMPLKSSLHLNASLEHSWLPLNLWHMRRAFAGAKGHNFVLGFTLVFLTVLTSFTFVLYNNVNVHPEGFVNTLVEEHPSIVVGSPEDIKDELEQIKGVERALYYDDKTSLSFDGQSYTAFVSESFDGLANDLCYEGRNPSASDEVALGSALADAYDISLGEYVTLSYEGTSAEYRVVGFVQSVNNSGEIIEMTKRGYEQVRPEYQPATIYLYISGDDAPTIKTVIKHIEKHYGESVTVMNYAESMNAAAGMFVSLVSTLAVILVAVSALLILFILSVFARAIMSERQREIGIMKSIGNTSRQLSLQLAGGFAPSIVIGVLCGVGISLAVMPALYRAVFAMVGAYKVNFIYPPNVYIIVGVAMILLAFALSILAMRRTRTVSVANLLRS